ncbi:DUF6078 family protein [Bacteroides sp. AN502(2024)]|uniref:DUF6078 family protein n=1 Tax=Bacteroides sp. AN502(2024) TaxID=3160599 RepID=UPI003514809B
MIGSILMPELNCLGLCMEWRTIRHLLDNVPHKDEEQLKSQMLGYFGRGMYYRFYRKERYWSLGQQEYIRRIFRQKGITEKPAFDSYTEEYIW